MAWLRLGPFCRVEKNDGITNWGCWTGAVACDWLIQDPGSKIQHDGWLWMTAAMKGTFGRDCLEMSGVEQMEGLALVVRVSMGKGFRVLESPQEESSCVKNQTSQANRCDKKAMVCDFKVGDKVLLSDCHHWSCGTASLRSAGGKPTRSSGKEFSACPRSRKKATIRRWSLRAR